MILIRRFSRSCKTRSCYQKFNQNVRSYSHDYEAHSITLRFADDASQNLLFTVYSDGVCQVNGKFVFLRSPMETQRRSTSCCGMRWCKECCPLPGMRLINDRNKTKSGHSGGQAECPVLFSSAHSAVPEPCVRAKRMQSKPECCILPRKKRVWNGGMERSACRRSVFGASWLELANRRCENRIP